MIKVYKDYFAGTQEELDQELQDYTTAINNHKNTVNEPFPQVTNPIIKTIYDNNLEYEWIGKTMAEEQTDERQVRQDELVAAKLDAETTPSENYADYRQAEYPDLGEGLDALVKWAKERRDTGEELPSDVDTYVDDCLAVKTKYPKPS